MVPSRSLTASFVPLLVVVVLAGQELSAQLPSDAGQVWKTYDISPFVAKAGKGSAAIRPSVALRVSFIT